MQIKNIFTGRKSIHSWRTQVYQLRGQGRGRAAIPLATEIAIFQAKHS